MALKTTTHGNYDEGNNDPIVWTTDPVQNNNLNNGMDSHKAILIDEAPAGKKVDPFAEKVFQDDKPHCKKDEKVSWSEFTANTTFHGIRYIFNSSFKLRQVLWVLCVVAAVAYFAWQVGERTSDYFKYATNVDVKVIYTEKLRFPAVTLCNQNNFRTTAMVENGLYYFIDDFYSAANMTGVNFTAYDLNDFESHDFITTTSHQLRDLIDQCFWNKMPCDLENDFVRTITDVGVCYTFNSGQKKDTRIVNEYGNQFGLKLILNVEQYEYMKGPNNDAGVKILLHDQKEQPLMRDNGFAVEPGTHTLVAIDMSEVRSMAPPYGTCDSKMARGTRSHCLLQCQREALDDLCQCYDVYMTNDTVKMCDLHSLFQCARDSSQNQALSGRSCDCGVPCMQIKYEPSFSYARLSQFNLERMVLVDQERRSIVEDTFALALEYSQRVDPEIVANDEEQLVELMDFVEDLEEIINETFTGLSSEANFQNTYSIPLPIINGEELFTADRQSLTDIRNSRDDYITNQIYYEMDYNHYDSHSNQYYALLDDLSPKLGEIFYDVLTLYNETLYLGERLMICENVSESSSNGVSDVTTTTTTQAPNSSTPSYENSYNSYNSYNYNYHYNPFYNYHYSYNSYNYYYYSSPDIQHCLFYNCYSMSNSDVVASCQTIFDAAKQKAEWLVSTLRNAFENENRTMANFASVYQETLEYLYNETFVGYADIAEHITCQENLAEIEVFFDLIPQIETALEILSNSETKDEMIANADALYRLMNDTLIQKYMTMDETFKGSCTWFNDYSGYNWDGQCFHDSYNKDYDCDKVTSYFSNLESMKRAYELFEIGFTSLGRYINDMHTTMRIRIGPVLKDTILDYLDMNITKMELAEVMESLLGRKSLQDIVGDGTDFVSTALETIREAALIRHNLKEAYRSILTTVVPIFNISEFRSTPFIRFLIAHNVSDTNAMLDQLEHNATNVMDDLLEYIFGGYVDNVTEIRNELSNSIDNLADAAERLDEDLEEYIQLGRMNEDFYMNNFLQVDLFYKELSYEQVEQQPTFGFPSLLSEVGGFLGLLLGASILTVCELLDYITMAVYTKCRRGKEINPEPQ